MNLLLLCLSGIVLLETVSAQGIVTAWSAGGAPGGGPGAGVTYNAIKTDPNILKLVKMGILAPFTNSFVVIQDPKKTATNDFQLNVQNLKTKISSVNEAPTASLPTLSESSYSLPKSSKVNHETFTIPSTVKVVKMKTSAATTKMVPTSSSKIKFITPETTKAPVTSTSATTTPVTTTPSSTTMPTTIPSTTDLTTTATNPTTIKTLTTQKLPTQKIIRPFIPNIFSGKIGIPKQNSESFHQQTYQTSDLNTENISNTHSQNTERTKVKTQYDTDQNIQEHIKLGMLKSVTNIKPLSDTPVSNKLDSQIHVSSNTILIKEKPIGIKLAQGAINSPLSNYGYKPTKTVDMKKVESSVSISRDTILTKAIPDSIKLAKDAINGAVSNFEYERTSFKKTMLALLKTLVMIQDYIRTNMATTTAALPTTTTAIPTTTSPTTTTTTTTQPTTTSTTTTTTQPTTASTQATNTEAFDMLVVPSQEAYHQTTVTTHEKAIPLADTWPEATPSWDSAMDFVRKYVAAVSQTKVASPVVDKALSNEQKMQQLTSLLENISPTQLKSLTDMIRQKANKKKGGPAPRDSAPVEAPAQNRLRKPKRQPEPPRKPAFIPPPPGSNNQGPPRNMRGPPHPRGPRNGPPPPGRRGGPPPGYFRNGPPPAQRPQQSQGLDINDPKVARALRILQKRLPTILSGQTGRMAANPALGGEAPEAGEGPGGGNMMQSMTMIQRLMGSGGLGGAGGGAGMPDLSALFGASGGGGGNAGNPFAAMMNQGGQGGQGGNHMDAIAKALRIPGMGGGERSNQLGNNPMIANLMAQLSGGSGGNTGSSQGGEAPSGGSPAGAGGMAALWAQISGGSGSGGGGGNMFMKAAGQAKPTGSNSYGNNLYGLNGNMASLFGGGETGTGGSGNPFAALAGLGGSAGGSAGEGGFANMLANSGGAGMNFANLGGNTGGSGGNMDMAAMMRAMGGMSGMGGGSAGLMQAMANPDGPGGAGGLASLFGRSGMNFGAGL